MYSKGFGLKLALACVVLSGMVAPTSAATVSRDQLSRKLLDNCVYRQFEVKDVERSRMVDRCRCATDAAMASLPGEEFQLPRSGGLTSEQDRAIRTGIAACFK